MSIWSALGMAAVVVTVAIVAWSVITDPDPADPDEWYGW